MLSTCRVLVKNLKGSKFNVQSRKYFYVQFFQERNGTPKSYGFIRGCLLAGNNNETFCIYIKVRFGFEES